MTEQTTAPELLGVRADTLSAYLAPYPGSRAPEVRVTGQRVDMGGDLERIVTTTRYAAQVKRGAASVFTLAARGDTVLVTAAEAARGEALGALVEVDAAESDEPGATVAVTALEGVLSDAALAALRVEDTVAYVNEHPAELDRVLAAERRRDRPRTTVLALEEQRDAYAEAAAAALAARVAATEQL